MKKIQVMNYGLGGKISLHSDGNDMAEDAKVGGGISSLSLTFLGLPLGNHIVGYYASLMNKRETIYAKVGGGRLTTAMLYLTTVDAGGRTVFPRLGLSMQPKAGNLVFWHTR